MITNKIQQFISQQAGERRTFDIFWNRTIVFGQSLMKIPDNEMGVVWP